MVAQAQGVAATREPPAGAVSGAGEVTLDFVARDSHSRPVRDLRSEEIRITDGGAPAKIARLQLVNGGNGGQQAAAPRLVSLLFDGLDTYASPAVRKAATGMLNSLVGTGASFSVWRISDRLELVQPFTKDGALLTRAIETATGPPRNPTAGSPAGGAQPAGDPLTLNAQRTLEGWERIERDEKLRPPIAALVALARQQTALNGRKAVVYFSDGVQVEACPPDQVRSAIGSANRAGVVLYTVNIGGLSEAAEKRASSILDSNAAASDGQPSAAPAAAKPAPGSVPFTFIQLDTDAGPRLPLKDLAESTGGLYIRRSSDLAPSVGKIVDDLTTYYEVAYAAPLQERNGQFRAVSVRTSRPQTRLQSRDGYFALPADTGPDTAPFEVPLLKALSAPERTETIPFRIDILHLGQAQGKARGEAVLELPLAGINCKVDPALGLCDMHFSVLAQIKDAAGQVLEKFSQDVPDQMASEGLESAGNSVYTLDRSFSLPPGEYRLEAAVLDRQAKKLSSRTTSFSLSATPDLAVCDLFLVRTLEPLWSATDRDDPLRYQDGRVVPLLIPVWRGADRDVQAFFLVSPDARIAVPPRVVVEVQRDGKVVERPAIKALERRPGAPIPVTSTLKRSLLEPGHYQLLVRIAQGKASLERKLNFEVLTPPAPVIAALPADAGKSGAPSEGVAALLDVKLIEGAPKPEDAELNRILAAARERAADYRDALPDFVCTRTTTKFSKSKDGSGWAPAISSTDLLQFVEGEEKTQTLTSRQVANVPAMMKKLDLFGELGGVLSLVFNEHHFAEIEWKGMAEMKGIRVHVFQYRVARTNSGYMLSLGDQQSQVLAAYRGTVQIDANSMAIRRVVVEAVDLPKNFPIQQSAIAVDYDFVRIGGKRYLVPQHATWLYVGANSKQPMKSDRAFQNYRKYTTTSGIKYMGEAGSSSSQGAASQRE
ncbi:MAG: VWA domain-containing protein [Bryobacteraceae bacterium]